jgi:histidinol-phosphatase (PHP family)
MARYPMDYHLHSNLSIDCRVPMEAQCERAVELGIAELCVTDHCDWHRLDEGTGFYRPAAYFERLEACRATYGEQLTLLAGVELGEPHLFAAEAQALLAHWPYDFVIGSLHWVDDRMSLDPAYFDGRSAADAYNAYFEEMAVMAAAGGFDVVGHFDVPKRYGFALHGGYDANEYADSIHAALRACVDSGVGLEINTSTYRRGLAEPCPSLPILRWYRELGGEILTIGSDSHQPETLAGSFDEALDVAREAGFHYLAHFRQRTPHFQSIA